MVIVMGMAKTALARTGMSQWSADSDLWPGRSGFNAEYLNLNQVVAIYGQGTTASRPVAAFAGRYYWATDTKRLWYDNGTIWEEVSPVGGGGTPATLVVGGAGTEGVSRIAARADHNHPLSAPAVDPAAVTYGGAAGRGASSTPARADHTHALAALPTATVEPPAVSYGGSGAAGSSGNVARQDHTHALAALPLASTAPGSLTFGQTGSVGSATTLARADHAHGLANLPLATSPPGAVVEAAAGVTGTSTSVARADHTHALNLAVWGGTFVGDGGTALVSGEGGEKNFPLTASSGTQGGASITSGRVVIPQTGSYMGFVRVAFSTATETATGTRAAFLEVNGVSVQGDVRPSAYPHTTTVYVPFRRRLTAGNTVGIRAWQDASGVIQAPDVELGIQLVALG